MNLHRLSTLSAHLRNNVDPRTFDYTDWHCCAVGHAARIPEFQAAGFTLDGLGIGPMRAAIRFFELSYDDANFLFLTPFRSPAEAADRIDGVIADETRRRAAADVAAVTRPDLTVFDRVDTPAG